MKLWKLITLKILHKIDKKVNLCQKLNIYFLKNFAKNLEVNRKTGDKTKKKVKIWVWEMKKSRMLKISLV